ncbi:CCA tRNA nucleotidyltransferase [Methylorubrum extorquens]|uniref:CCA tRNA nucleotidyltransferase n=1 Tax=Methylorubrum extorquens TaxID=408 RepID=UPI0001590A18|nr:CCA tRNA nucleotidyltransferase [Methylorubrum extorquens]ABY29865.1 Polynucleotide adenylyltransferase region [Methylorubrum extorquens PA1]KQP92527.1 poly(A) polymerase [Methylobacterium sp. Leaf119]WIU41183.1 CCA tRNA nucleotidyltransferase [Methylorubrum extorquens]
MITDTLPSSVAPPLAADGPARLLARAGVQACLTALDAPGEETRLVGGCVRDALLGTIVADIDLATTLRPEAVMACARKAGIKAVGTGIEHGTVTLVVGGEPHEVTTLREDVETDGRHAVVRFGRDFVRDAERRDFTINALSLDAGGRLHDTTGGVADLAAGRVRFIGDAATRLREDALRLLRFFRFHARYGSGAPDAEGLAASIAARDSLDRLSRERVRAEFLKLLLAPRAVDAVAILSETGLLPRILGGVGELGRLARCAEAEPRLDATARFAALAVRTIEDADRLQASLRLSRAEHARLTGYAIALAALHDRPVIEADAVPALVATYGAGPLRELLIALDGEPRPRVTPEARTKLDRMEAAGTRPVLPVTGADLVARGVAPGRAVGAGLRAARDLWLASGCPDDAETRERLIARALEAAAAP